jgi:preprotein translocase subunit SecG
MPRSMRKRSLLRREGRPGYHPTLVDGQEEGMLSDYFKIALIVVGGVLIGLIMMQVRGGGFGDMFSGDSLYRTRRGVEKTMHNMTIVFATLFLVFSLLSVLYSS